MLHMYSTPNALYIYIHTHKWLEMCPHRHNPRAQSPLARLHYTTQTGSVKPLFELPSIIMFRDQQRKTETVITVVIYHAPSDNGHRANSSLIRAFNLVFKSGGNTILVKLGRYGCQITGQHTQAATNQSILGDI